MGVNQDPQADHGLLVSYIFSDTFVNLLIQSRFSKIAKPSTFRNWLHRITCQFVFVFSRAFNQGMHIAKCCYQIKVYAHWFQNISAILFLRQVRKEKYVKNTISAICSSFLWYKSLQTIEFINKYSNIVALNISYESPTANNKKLAIPKLTIV